MPTVGQLVKPKNATEQSFTQKASLSLMRNLVSASVSSIAYLRNLFDEDSFVDCELNRLQIKKLKRSKSPEADQLLNWIEQGVYEALEKKYLHTLIFGIYGKPEAPDSLTESFTFKFYYDEDDNACFSGLEMVHSKSSNQNADTKHALNVKRDISAAAMSLFRTLIILNQTLKPLQKPCYLTMKLYYHPNTPKDFEPKCFKPADFGNFSFAQSPTHIKIGSVSTPYHQLSLAIHSLCQEETQNDHGLDSSQEEEHNREDSFSDSKLEQLSKKANRQRANGKLQVESRVQESKTKALRKGVAENLEQESSARCKVQTDDGFEILAIASRTELTPQSKNDSVEVKSTGLPKTARSSQTRKDSKDLTDIKRLQGDGPPKKLLNGTAEESSDISAHYGELDCVCGLDDEEEALVQCVKCQCKSHASCAGFLDVKSATLTSQFTCDFCANPDAYSNSQVWENAWKRRIVSRVYQSKLHSVSELAELLHLPFHKAMKMVENLEELDIIRPTSTSNANGRRQSLRASKSWTVCFSNPSAFNKLFPKEAIKESKRRKVSQPKKPIIIRDD